MVTQVLKKEAGNMLPRPVRTMHRRGILRIALVLVTALILLCVRLGDLMLAKSEHYKELAYDLHTRERQLKAMRGEIQDRNGKVLAANRTNSTARIGIVPKEVPIPIVINKPTTSIKNAAKRRAKKGRKNHGKRNYKDKCRKESR